MPFLDQFDTKTTRHPAPSVSWPDVVLQKPTRGLVMPLLIASILMAVAGAMVWVFRPQPPQTSTVRSAPPDEPSAVSPSAVATATPKPPPVPSPAPRGGGAARRLVPISLVAPKGSEGDIKSAEA